IYDRDDGRRVAAGSHLVGVAQAARAITADRRLCIGECPTGSVGHHMGMAARHTPDRETANGAMEGVAGPLDRHGLGTDARRKTNDDKGRKQPSRYSTSHKSLLCGQCLLATSQTTVVRNSRTRFSHGVLAENFSA